MKKLNLLIAQISYILGFIFWLDIAPARPGRSQGETAIFLMAHACFWMLVYLKQDREGQRK